MTLTQDFKETVKKALFQQRENFSGSDASYSKQYGINSSVFSRLKNGETDKLVRDSDWLQIGRQLGVNTSERKWNACRTDVFESIEQDILFCKTNSKAKICVADCGIGKTFTAKYLSRALKNCFYVDASQAKSKQQFVRLIARTVGIDFTGKFNDVNENLKYYLAMLPEPIVIIDEAGDLDYTAFLELKELWNATENTCGWYMIGADGLREKIYKGIRNHKVGFREIFSRFSERFTTIVPVDRDEKKLFYRKLLTDVLSANVPVNPEKGHNNDLVKEITNKCLQNDALGSLGALRRAESLLIIHQGN